MTARITRVYQLLLASMLLLMSVLADVSAQPDSVSPSGEIGIAEASRLPTTPVSLVIPDAAVDAEVERNQIDNGVMLNPSGPWVVSWYEETALLGEVNNTVLAGHVDYWGVGPAVFWTIRDLSEGAPMQVRGENGALYTFEVEWVRTYAVADLTPEMIRATIGPTDYRAVTLITCGGAFDEATGSYLSRTIVRGKLVDTDPVPPSTYSGLI